MNDERKIIKNIPKVVNKGKKLLLLWIKAKKSNICFISFFHEALRTRSMVQINVIPDSHISNLLSSRQKTDPLLSARGYRKQ